MVSPARFPGGVTNTAPFQALGSMGQPNPAFYHTVFDDFDDFVASKWTSTPLPAANGTVTAAVAGVGGQIQFVSGATIGNGYAIYKAAAGFQLTATTDAGNSPKVFFYTSLAASAIANATVLAGLINVTANPITTAPTDGIWFSKAVAGGLQINYTQTNVTATGTAAQSGGVTGVAITNPGFGYLTPPAVTFSGGGGTGAAATAVLTRGVVTSVVITAPGTGYTTAPTVAFAAPPVFTPLAAILPVASYVLANSAFIDLAFSVTSQGSILAWAGANQIGYIPQSGSGANTPAAPYPAVRLTPVAPMTGVLLTPTVTVGAGTAAAQTVNIDYILAAQER